MRLREISVNNLRRRKGKMIFLILGLLIGIGTVVNLVSITTALNTDLREKLDKYGANIVVTPKSEQMTFSYGGIQVSSEAVDVKDLRQEDLAKITGVAEAAKLSLVSPKLIGATTVLGKEAVITGVDLPTELQMKKWWSIVGREPQNANEVIVGYAASSELGLMPGSKFQLKGEDFLVAGTLEENGSQDDSMVFMDLAKAQSMLGKPGILSLIEITAQSKEFSPEQTVKIISGILPDAKVSALKQAVGSREQTVNQLTSFAGAVSIAVLFIGSLIVFTTMTASVNERTREIGIFRAMGFRRSHIMKIILLEAAIISVVGGIIGWLIGMVSSIILAPAIAQLSVGIEWNPLLAVGAIFLAILVGVGGSIYPAIRASNLDPAEALRFV